MTMPYIFNKELTVSFQLKVICLLFSLSDWSRGRLRGLAIGGLRLLDEVAELSFQASDFDGEKVCHFGTLRLVAKLLQLLNVGTGLKK